MHRQQRLHIHASVGPVLSGTYANELGIVLPVYSESLDLPNLKKALHLWPFEHVFCSCVPEANLPLLSLGDPHCVEASLAACCLMNLLLQQGCFRNVETVIL